MTATAACAGTSRVPCPACGAPAVSRWWRTITGRLVPGRTDYGCACPEARFAVAAAVGGQDGATGRVIAGQGRLGI